MMLSFWGCICGKGWCRSVLFRGNDAKDAISFGAARGVCRQFTEIVSMRLEIKCGVERDQQGGTRDEG